MFFSCKKVSPLSQSNPNANICAVVQSGKHAFCHDIELPQQQNIEKKIVGVVALRYQHHGVPQLPQT